LCTAGGSYGFLLILERGPLRRGGMAKPRSPKNERRAEEVLRTTMRALASLTEDDWQELTDEERAEVKAMLADKAWFTRHAFFWKE
jgi:hypothetical protein